MSVREWSRLPARSVKRRSFCCGGSIANFSQADRGDSTMYPWQSFFLSSGAGASASPEKARPHPMKTTHQDTICGVTRLHRYAIQGMPTAGRLHQNGKLEASRLVLLDSSSTGRVETGGSNVERPDSKQQGAAQAQAGQGAKGQAAANQQRPAGRGFAWLR